MEFTIKSSKLNATFEFTCPRTGGYIRLLTGESQDPHGRQICEGGGFSGVAFRALSEREFERLCRRWYRAHMRLLGDAS